MTLEELEVLITANTQGLQKEINFVKGQLNTLGFSATSASNKVSGAFGNMSKMLSGTLKVFAAVGVGLFIKKSMQLAMNAVESENLFSVAMGGMADSARKWSEELQASLGLNAVEVRKNTGMFFTMTKSMGLSEKQAYDLSTGLTQLAYDMSSFYNFTPEEMFDKLRAGISGETEPLKRLGILVNENTVAQTAYRNGIANTGAKLTEQQKVLARYMTIMEATKDAQGDLARTIMSPSNQIRILNAQLQLVMRNLGNAFLPILQIVLPILTNFMRMLVQVTNTFASFMHTLFGTNTAASQQQQVKDTNAVAKAQTNLGDSIAKAGKKAKQGVMGFDEVNSLQESMADNADSAAEGGAGGLAGYDITSGMQTPDSTPINKFALKLREGFEQIAETINKNKQPIVIGLGMIAGALGAFAVGSVVSSVPGVVAQLTEAFKALWLVLGKHPVMIIITIIGALIGGLVTAYKTNEEFRKSVDSFAKVVGQSIKVAWDNFSKTMKDLWENVIKPLGNYLRDVFNVAWEYLKKVMDALWKNVLVPIGDFLLWFYQVVIEPLAKVVGDVLVMAWNALMEVLEDLYNNILKPLGSLLKDVFIETLETLSAIAEAFWKEVLEPLGKFLGNTFKPLIEALMKAFTELWDKALKPLVQWLFDVFVKGFETASETIGTTIESAKLVLKGILKFIQGVFKDDWKTAWDGLTLIFKGVWNGFKGIAEGVINAIISGLNNMINMWNRISFTIPSEVPGIGGKTIGVPAIPTITPVKLARGTIVDRPTNAIIGEAGPEAVIPLENTSFVDKLASSVGSAVMAGIQMSLPQQSGLSGGNDKPIEVILNIDGVTFARGIYPRLQSEAKRVNGGKVALSF